MTFNWNIQLDRSKDLLFSNVKTDICAAHSAIDIDSDSATFSAADYVSHYLYGSLPGNSSLGVGFVGGISGITLRMSANSINIVLSMFLHAHLQD